MDSDAWRSENDKCNASSLWVNGLWDKAKRTQKLRRHCCFGVCISGHSLVRSTKVMQCEWCQSILDDCAWLFILCLFTINFILHSDSLVITHLLWRPTRQKPPNVLCFIVRQAMNQDVGLRKLLCHPLLGAFFQIICVVLDSLLTEERGGKALSSWAVVTPDLVLRHVLELLSGLWCCWQQHMHFFNWSSVGGYGWCLTPELWLTPLF